VLRKTLCNASLPRPGTAFMLLKVRFLFALSLVVLFSLTANAGNATAKFRTSPVAGSVNLQDFGAVGDGIADDGPALQSALDSLAALGGGTLIVPSGRYAIITPVEKNFEGIASITLIGAEPAPDSGSGGVARGLGLTSEFVVRVGQTNTALSIAGVGNLLIQDITFIGNPEVEKDCQRVLVLSEIEKAIIRHCEFYGLGAIVDGGAIVYAFHSNLTVENSAFLGCSTATSNHSAVIQNISWRGITITGTRFIDYGRRANFFSKTTLSPPNSWISIGNAAAADATSARREVVLRDLFLDEGVFNGISCYPTFYSSVYTPINLIFISGVRMNVNNLRSYGIVLSGVERVLIEKSNLGWSHNADAGISLIGVGEAIIDQTECVDHASRIRADATTQRLTVVNSIYEYLDSLAQVTEVVNTESLDQDPVEYVRQQYLEMLNREPDAAGYFYWSSRLLRCGEDEICANDTRNALTVFLGGNPSPTFTLSGNVAESDARAVSGATVTLSGSAGWVTQTDDNGHYSFPNLPTGGSYTVAVARKNYVFDQPSQVVTEPVGNRTANFSGRMITYVVTGRALRANGQGIAGAVINLSGTQSAAATTDSNGNYRFDDVRAEGPHTITIERENYDFDRESVTVNGLLANLVVNFTGTVHKYTISGDIPMSGVDVTISGDANATVQTTSAFIYIFTVEAEGRYTVRASKTHYTFTPVSYTFTNVVAHQTLNFNPKLNTHTISGSTGVSGVLVTLSGSATGAVTTGADGKYSFTVNAGGNYSVAASKTLYTFAPSNNSFTSLSGDVVANFTPQINTYTISGSTGFQGVSVALSGSQTGAVTTGADGKYSFTVNAGGSYTVTPSKANYTFAPLSRSFTGLNANQTADFSSALNAYTISGSCGLEGVTVRLQGDATGTVTTGADGKYTFTVNAGGSYTVTPSKTNYTFASLSKSFASLSANQTADFTPTLNAYAISGSTGLSGVEVRLQGGATGTLTTGADGKYSFTVNAGGNYTVTASKAHYTFTPPSRSFTNLSGSQTANFTPQLNTYMISGSTGLQGVKVTLSGDATGSMTTAANGLYSFTVNALGNYTVTADRSDYVFTPASHSLTALAPNQVANFAGTPRPALLTENGSDLALALTTVNLLRGPFSVVNNLNFSPDQRTRIMLFATNATLQPNEPASTLTVFAEDAKQNVYQLTVEYTGAVDGQPQLTQINIKLPDAIYNISEAWLSIKVRGISSNKVRIRIVPYGSGTP
jgi:hypothetical protein